MPATERAGQTAFISGYLRGDAEILREVDGWIDVVLRQRFPSLRGEWEDLRQEVQARLYRNLGRGDFAGSATLRTYVHRIATNVCIDALRKVRMERATRTTSDVAFDPPAPGATSGSSYMAREILSRLLEGLSDGERRLLHLVHVEQRSYAELGRDLGLSEGAVKLRVFRTRRKLIQRRRALMGPAGRHS